MSLNIDLNDRHARMSALTTWVDSFWSATSVCEYTKDQAEAMLSFLLSESQRSDSDHIKSAMLEGKLGGLAKMALLRANGIGLRISAHGLLCVTSMA